jgi:hypothetical protein
MTVHGIDLSAELLGIIAAIAALLVFTLAVAIHHRSTVQPGSGGHRDIDDSEHERIRADGYIDSFSKEIEEAGGGLPLIVRLAIILILAWFVIYLVLFLSPR